MLIKRISKLMKEISKELGSEFNMENIKDNKFLIHSIDTGREMTISLDKDIYYSHTDECLCTYRDDLDMCKIIENQCFLLLSGKADYVS